MVSLFYNAIQTEKDHSLERQLPLGTCLGAVLWSVDGRLFLSEKNYTVPLTIVVLGTQTVCLRTYGPRQTSRVPSNIQLM